LSEEYKGRHNPQKAEEYLMGKNVPDEHMFSMSKAKTRSSKTNLEFTAPELASCDLANVQIKGHRSYYG
jgi:hypothetical protein